MKRKEDGLWQGWDSLGHIIDSSVYNNGEKIIQATFGYHKNGTLESLIINNFKTEMVEKTYYDDSGNIVSKTNFKNIVDEDKVFTKTEIEASFPGGVGGWTKYISREILKSAYEFSKKDYGTCIVKFIVGIDGKVSDVEATTMKGSKLAEIAMHAILNGPKWVPAMQNGRYVRAYRMQPVTIMNPGN